MKLRVLIIMILVCCTILSVLGCQKNDKQPTAVLQVVTTLFPLYDFSRTIAGDKAQVTMLLPPGVEPHAFEPKPEDMIRISRAGLFVYTNRYMEPWAEKIISGVSSKSLRVVNSGERITYKNTTEVEHSHKHNAADTTEMYDPHIWLDFANAGLMIDAILDGFIVADPGNGVYYRKNAEALKEKLTNLDGKYRKSLSSCKTRKLLHGGHYTFGYLSKRYGLDYHALSGISSDSEPSAERMAELIREIRSSGTKFLFAEELLSPRLTETLAQETATAVLMLHGAHNLSRDDLSRKVSFIDLMEKNLEQLQKGLECQAK